MIYLPKPLKYKNAVRHIGNSALDYCACTHANCTTIAFFERTTCSNCSIIQYTHVYLRLLSTQCVSGSNCGGLTCQLREPELSASYGRRNRVPVT